MPPPQPNFSKAILNVLIPQEVRSQKYANPNRVLIGADGLRYSWIDNSRLVVVQLIGEQVQDNGLRSYLRAYIQIYNADTDQFEYPMNGYIANIYDAHIAPDRKKFLFDVLDENSSRSYLVTDITGAELKTLSTFTGNWYEK